MKTSVPPAAVSDYRGQVEDHASALRGAGLLHEELFIGRRWVPASTWPSCATAGAAAAAAGQLRAATGRTPRR
jgi:hypothetical protein